MLKRTITTGIAGSVLVLAILGAVSTAQAQNRLATARLNWDGSLYAGFGDGGIISDESELLYPFANALAIDSLGRLIVVGSHSGHFALACYNQYTGELDGSFGTGGRVETEFGASSANARAIAVAGNGDLLVAGSSLDPTERLRFAIARYNYRGVLLRSVETSFADFSSDAANAIAIDGSGRIVVAGHSVTFSGVGAADYRIAIARYDFDLEQDPTFGDSGLVVTNRNVNLDFLIYDREGANGIAFVGGDIVIAGHRIFGYSNQTDAYSSEFLVLRYRQDGSLHTGFGGGGGVVIPFTSYFTRASKTFRANAIAVDSSGRILVAGKASINSGGPYIALVRLKGDGSFDTTFSGDGKVLTSFGWTAPSEALAIALRGSTVMLAGWSGTGSTRTAVLTRYTSSGVLDTSFDGDGRASVNFACQGAETASALVLSRSVGTFQTYPRVYIGGYATGTPCP